MRWLKSLFKQPERPPEEVLESKEKEIELSFSRVQCYQRCPWMYHLVYNEGWRSGPSASAALGISLHRTLAAYLSLQNTERTLDRLYEIYDSEWVNEGFSTPQQTLDGYDKGRKILENFFEQDRKRTSEVVATEKEFFAKFPGGVSFRGTVDRLDRRADGSYEIVEYKTQAENWPASKLENDLQITLYSVGVPKSLGVDSVHLKFLFLSSGEEVAVERTDAQKQEAVDLMAKVASKIRRSNFAPNHGHCARCEFANRCSNFKPAHQLVSTRA